MARPILWTPACVVSLCLRARFGRSFVYVANASGFGRASEHGAVVLQSHHILLYTLGHVRESEHSSVIFDEVDYFVLLMSADAAQCRTCLKIGA